MLFTKNHDISIERRRITYALHHLRDLDAVFALLPQHLDSLPVIEALADFIEAPKAPYTRVIEAIELLQPTDHPAARRALIKATSHDLLKVRRAALAALAHDPAGLPWGELARQLSHDSSHHARIGLLELLAHAPEAHRWEVARAGDDPHWRGRKPLLSMMQSWADGGDDEALCELLSEEFAKRGIDGDRPRGLLAYADLYRDTTCSIDACDPEPYPLPGEPDLSARFWWHEEPTLLRRNLAALTRDEVRDEDIWLVWMLSNPHDRTRSMLIKALSTTISPGGVLSFLIHAADRRRHALDETREKFLARIGHDTLERCAWSILDARIAGTELAQLAGLPPIQVARAKIVSWAMRWLDENISPRSVIESSERWLEVLSTCLESAHAEERLCAIEILSGTSRSDDHGAALDVLRGDPDVRVAAAALAASNAPLSAEDFFDMLGGAHAHEALFRIACVEALAAREFEPYHHVWRTLCEDDAIDVRAHCAMKLVAASLTHAELEAKARELLDATATSSEEVRQACATLLDAIRQDALSSAMRELLESLQRDDIARVREAALTHAQSAQIVAHPEQETSWRVLERAADMHAQRVNNIVPAGWIHPAPEAPSQKALAKPAPEESLALTTLSTKGAWWAKVPLGATGLHVSRMGISGHYALPEEGFAEALELGINTYFWEPIYLSQTRFFKPLSKHIKSELVMCCGTFEATGKGLRRDVLKALKAMDLEQIQVFYIFWVRDLERLTDDMLAEMERCKREGLVHTFGVSTHSRALARGFLDEWPAIMVRHNAAHRGVEREVLPFVEMDRVGITTFSNLCYGRMISDLPAWERGVPSAEDAYRYSLTHEGVTSCWSAPSTIAQLRQNLSALTTGPMRQEELDRMREYGRELYRLNTGFDRFIRRR